MILKTFNTKNDFTCVVQFVHSKEYCPVALLHKIFKKIVLMISGPLTHFEDWRSVWQIKRMDTQQQKWVEMGLPSIK